MRALVYHRYGSADAVLRLEEIDRPAIGDHEMLVKVRSASVNPADWHYMTGTPYLARLQMGLLRPRRNIAGSDVAGTVEAVGGAVEEFRPGDDVFGASSGSFAEYAVVADDRVVRKPAEVTFEAAAAVPIAATTALQAVRDKGRIRPGRRVLVNGASGGVGTFAVQLAKLFGAEVTGVCSARNVGMVESIGADRVIDYTSEDFTLDLGGYDLLLDLVGNRSLAECRRVLSPDGVYVMSFGLPDNRWLGPLVKTVVAVTQSRFVGQSLVTWIARQTREDLAILAGLLAVGDLRPVITERYDPSEAIGAMRDQGAGHARGKTVVVVV